MNEDKKLDAVNNVIEKWAISALTLTAYLFISIKIIYSVTHPKPDNINRVTGRELVCVPFVPVLAHAMVGGIAYLILFFRMNYGKDFTKRHYVTTFIIICVPIILTLVLYLFQT